MKLLLGVVMSEDDLAEKASVAVEEINRQYVKLFGNIPGPGEIAWACINEQKCGWWDDVSDNLLAMERLTPSSHNGILDPTKPKASVKVVCPRCRSAIRAVAMVVFLEQARQRKMEKLLMGRKHNAPISSLRPA